MIYVLNCPQRVLSLRVSDVSMCVSAELDNWGSSDYRRQRWTMGSTCPVLTSPCVPKEIRRMVPLSPTNLVFRM